MKDLKTKEKFVQLRAEGKSFDSIANELKVSKTTLINWNKELARDINNAQYLAYQNLTEQYKITKQERINYLMRELQKIYDTLGQKDYNELPIKDLIFIKEKFESDLQKEFAHIEYRTGEFIEVDYFNTGFLDSPAKSEITYKIE